VTIHPQASLNQLQASDPLATVWVNANAGSGKTHVLVDRVVRLMLGGTEPSRIMCLTFTKAAAAEMANRLFERLSTWISLEDGKLAELLADLGSPPANAALLERARQLFTRALETPGGLKIQTIHAFCERVLQLFPVEAGIVPHFTMLDDRQSLELLQAARNAVLGQAKSDATSPLGLALLDIANRVQPDAFDALLNQLLARRANFRDFLLPPDGHSMADQFLRHHLSITSGFTPDGLRKSLAIDKDQYMRLADALGTGSATEQQRGITIRETCGHHGVTLLELQDILLTQKHEPRKSVANQPVLRRNSWIADFIPVEQNRLIDALAQLGNHECVSATLSVLRLGSAVVSEFENIKRRQGCYDFEDLIIKTGELLHDRPDAAWVLYKLDGGIEHMLVDEAQDTSPMQWQIVRALTEEFFAGEGRFGKKPRTVFVVGDRKQSIYSFQGADPDVFERVHNEVKDHAQGAGHVFRDVDLTVSFRSAPEILQAVDAVFHASSPARRGLDGAMERDWHHESNRRSSAGTVEIWPLTEPIAPEQQDPWEVPVDREPSHSPSRRLAKYLAQTIKGWIGTRMLTSHGRPVHAGDILILVRRRNAFFDAVIRALWNEQVPVAGADRLKLRENIAVLDLLALAQFTIMPEDDHALACILKSPLFDEPLSEDDLLAVAAGRTTSLWDSLQQRTGRPFAAAAATLLPLVRDAPAARPFEFLSAVLARCRKNFIARLGSEANDAIDALLDLALDYEEAHGSSLAGFVNWFAAGDVEIKRNMEPGRGEVRIMTVHGAKGLEAPIVILPDTVAVPDRNDDPLLMLPAGNGNARVPLWVVPKVFASPTVQGFKDAQKDIRTDEYRRLLYVAMTRARDELYVCGYRGAKPASDDCWYTTICNALKPLMMEIGEDKGWRLGAPPVPNPGVFDSARGSGTAIPDWTSKLVQMISVPPAFDPPRQKRVIAHVERGLLIHRILQQLPDLPEIERAAYIQQAVRRALAEPTLADDLTQLILDPLFVELFAEGGVSEVPLITEVPGRPPERRRIDRLVLTDTGLLIADYKTDRDVPADIRHCNPEYLIQMAAYRRALRKIHPDAAVRVALVWTEAPKLMLVPDEVLESMADQLSVTALDP
jgi:ATP-dependent helicase/nuclease subunit A